MGIGFNDQSFKEKKTEFEAPKPGNYRVIVDKSSKDGFSKRDKDQIILELHILDGEMKGRSVRHYLTDGPSSSLFIGLALEAFGISTAGLKEVSSKTFIGKTAVVNIVENDAGYLGVKRFLDRKYLTEDLPIAEKLVSKQEVADAPLSVEDAGGPAF